MQLDVIQREKEQANGETERIEVASLKKINMQQQTLLRRERNGRKKIVTRYIKVACEFVSFYQTNQSGRRYSTTTLIDILPDVLDLSDCCLTDEEVHTIRNTLLSRRPLLFQVIKFNGNHISDAGAKELASLIEYAGAFVKRNLRKVDLCGNSIGSDGLKSLASALTNNTDFNVTDVVVRDDGLIEGLVRVQAAGIEAFPTINSGGSLVASTEGGVYPNDTVVIDVRENTVNYYNSDNPSTYAPFQDQHLQQPSTHEQRKAKISLKKHHSNNALTEVYGKPLTLKEDNKQLKAEASALLSPKKNNNSNQSQHTLPLIKK